MKSRRIEELENYIHLKGKVPLKELEEKFDMSMNTIRRYVKTLLDKGEIIKVYGGVESIKNDLTTHENNMLVDIAHRNILNIEEKRNIAKFAAKFIDDGDMIYIDSGTTTVWILDYLDPNISLTIITNNLSVINKAVSFPNVNIIVSGNSYRRRINSFVKLGNHTILDKINIQKAFMAATSLSKESGVMNATVEEYELKSKVVSKSLKNYLLIDNNKFNKPGFITYAELSDFSTIITNKMTDDNLKNYLCNKNIELIECDNY